MDGGLSTDCGRKNMGFSTPFGAVLGMKKRHRHWPMAFNGYRLYSPEIRGLLLHLENHGIIKSNLIETREEKLCGKILRKKSVI